MCTVCTLIFHFPISDYEWTRCLSVARSHWYGGTSICYRFVRFASDAGVVASKQIMNRDKKTSRVHHHYQIKSFYRSRSDYCSYCVCCCVVVVVAIL